MPRSLFSAGLRRSLALIGLACAIALVGTGGTSAVASDSQGDGSYLALGDSVVFGFITADGFAYGNANNFVGYPDYVGRALNLDVANASCPGEASGGFLTAPPGGNGNGCRPFKAHFPLHVSYAGAATQMDFATNYLRSHPDTHLVTLGLGANDAFILQSVCGGDPNCLAAGLAAMSANLGTILGNIRATGYHGVLEVVNYYALDYGDPASVQGAQLLNHFVTATAGAHGAVIADVFTAWKNAASAAGGHGREAGLLNIAGRAPAPAFPNCDVHPSQSGQQLIAQTVETTYFAATQDQQN